MGDAKKVMVWGMGDASREGRDTALMVIAGYKKSVDSGKQAKDSAKRVMVGKGTAEDKEEGQERRTGYRIIGDSRAQARRALGKTGDG